ncbi:acetate/propionate family kinase [Ornithinimicrobium faecis]|uniref:acetate/propionate family kinase n=1 Tax=Ornithinimicrobium faecis TaxID=2934158 RepID=UPI0021183E22|nr:acetate kinase [Ornithinimicrobium sp. HY1745]
MPTAPGGEPVTDAGGPVADGPVLVINAGSSSLKYQLVVADSGESLATGLIERIGLDDGRARHSVDGQDHVLEQEIPDHAAAFDVLTAQFAEHGPDLQTAAPVAVGHRVVHGGAQFASTVLIDDEVLATLRRLVPLAPLHNPGNIAGIETALETFPDLPQVAVFDTAFHQTMPPAAYTYAVPLSWRQTFNIRAYGFHGTSHAYVSRRVADLLDRPLEETNTVVLHLGNGASACAVQGGRSVDTSMGLSPLGGLVMGTRPGDLDPGLPAHLSRVAGMTLPEFDHALNKESGLQALAGDSDFRQVMERRDAGDEAAGLAFDVVVHRLVRHLGALALVLGRLDAIAFTAGIGENSPELRAAVLERAGLLGVALDAAANESPDGETRISTADSAVAAFVVPTNEEWEIAREATRLLGHEAVYRPTEHERASLVAALDAGHANPDSLREWSEVRKGLSGQP